MNEQFTLVSSCHLFYLTRYLLGKLLTNLRNTEALYSYLGLSALSKFFFVCIKFDKGGNSLPKHFERTANFHSNL